MVEPFLDATVKLCESTIADAGLTSRDLSGAYLAGENRHLPAFKRAIQSHLHQSLKTIDETTALAGASIRAATLQGNSVVSVHDVLPFRLGIWLSNDEVAWLLPRRSMSLPIEASQTFLCAVSAGSLVVRLVGETHWLEGEAPLPLTQVVLDGPCLRVDVRVSVQASQHITLEAETSREKGRATIGDSLPDTPRGHFEFPSKPQSDPSVVEVP